MKTWNEKIAELNLTEQPLTKGLLFKTLGSSDGCYIDLQDNLEEAIQMAVVIDIIALTFVAGETDNLISYGSLSIPKDKVLAFVCGAHFFTKVISLLEKEGHTIDINSLAVSFGNRIFVPYDDEARLGLTEMGVKYWQLLLSEPPPQVVEWYKAFSFMVSMHYEQLVNDKLELHGLTDLDSKIREMSVSIINTDFTLAVNTYHPHQERRACTPTYIPIPPMRSHRMQPSNPVL